MSRVLHRQSTLVFESDCRVGEVDTVSLEIARRFDRIPLEVHALNVCTNVQRVKGWPNDANSADATRARAGRGPLERRG